MDTIKQRAEEYAKRIKEEQEVAYIFTDVEVLVEEAYEAGAREEQARQEQARQEWKLSQQEMLVIQELNER